MFRKHDVTQTSNNNSVHWGNYSVVGVVRGGAAALAISVHYSQLRTFFLYFVHLEAIFLNRKLKSSGLLSQH